MKKAAIGAGIGYLIWSRFKGIFGIMFLIFLLVLWFNPDPSPPFTASERRAARQIERNEDFAKPNRLIISLKKAIADRNISEIDRLYAGAIHSIELAADGRGYTVVRDVEIMLNILETCPVEIKNRQWGLDRMSYSLTLAQEILEEKKQRDDAIEAYRLHLEEDEERRRNGG